MLANKYMSTLRYNCRVGLQPPCTFTTHTCPDKSLSNKSSFCLTSMSFSMKQDISVIFPPKTKITFIQDQPQCSVLLAVISFHSTLLLKTQNFTMCWLFLLSSTKHHLMVPSISCSVHKHTLAFIMPQRDGQGELIWVGCYIMSWFSCIKTIT